MRFFSLSIIIFLGVVVNTQAQQQLSLSSGCERKIAVSDKKIAKGDAIVAKKDKYVRQIEAIEAQGNSRSGKMRRLQTKSNKIVVTSASFYKEGYGKKYNTYKKVVGGGIKEGILQQDAAGLMNSAKGEYKDGRKLRRKVSNLSDVNRAADMLLDANKKEANAIQTLVKATGKFRQVEIEIEAPINLVQELPMDSTSMVVAAAVPIVTSGLAFALDSADAAPMAVLSQPNTQMNTDSTVAGMLPAPTLNADSLILFNDSLLSRNLTEPLLRDTVLVAAKPGEPSQVYFSVQFLADRNAISKERLAQVYDGPFEILEHVAEGWYRYSFGKFATLSEANQMKTRSGVQGYVVAYLNEKRISIKEATVMLEK